MNRCGAVIFIGDDYGDNSATVICQLPEGHEGYHCEKFMRGENSNFILWKKDERNVCERCGALFVHRYYKVVDHLEFNMFPDNVVIERFVQKICRWCKECNIEVLVSMVVYKLVGGKE